MTFLIIAVQILCGSKPAVDPYHAGCCLEVSYLLQVNCVGYGVPDKESGDFTALLVLVGQCSQGGYDGLELWLGWRVDESVPNFGGKTSWKRTALETELGYQYQD